MEDGVREGVLPWNCVGPQLLHEEHLIGQRWNDSCKKGNNSDSLWILNNTLIDVRFERQTQNRSRHQPSLAGRDFLIQSVKCLTKSKKKSPSGTLITCRHTRHTVVRQTLTYITHTANTFLSILTSHEKGIFCVFNSGSEGLILYF